MGGNALRTDRMQCPSCFPSSMLVRKDPETAPRCPIAGMRCGLPASSRQCGRCLGWSSTYAEAADTSEPPNASPIPHHRSGFNRRAAYDIPCSVPALANADDPNMDDQPKTRLICRRCAAHAARQATALARPETPSDPAVSVHRLRACGHGRVARAGGRIVEARTPARAQGVRQRGLTGLDRLTPQARPSSSAARRQTGRRGARCAGAEQLKGVPPFSSQHTTSPSIRQDRTLRWFTAS